MISDNNFQLWCFGDSWAVGAELRLNDVAFAGLVARQFGCQLRNYGVIDQNLGLITRQIALHAAKINPEDLVLVVIPPDSRWYTEWTGIPYTNKGFFVDKTDDWFQYHHQLFIFAICEMLNKTGCTYLLMHNYGQYPLTESNYIMCQHHHHRFLDKKSLTHLLTHCDTDKLSPIMIEQTAIDDAKHIFHGQYFEGCRDHPNQAGHQRIADLIIERLTNESVSKTND